jgi:hypothetical protein
MNDTTAAVDAINNTFGTTVSSDIFMKGNTDSLFDGLTEDDLALPEKLVFLKGETVNAMIMDLSENSKFGFIKLEVKILSGDHEGKLTEMIFFKPKVTDGKMNGQSKKKFVDFLLAFWTKDEVLKGNVDLTRPISKKIQFTCGEAKEYKNKLQQDFYGIKIIE